jgi:transcriptional regulator with XRE-family HTH domain
MGRPENPLAPSGAVSKLAQQLRLLRERSSLTYQQMAARTHLPASTLSRAANGSTLPRWETVAAYAQACGADPATIRPSWEQARARHPRRRAAPRTGPRRGPYYPNQVTTVNDLISALRHLRVRAGQPTLLKIEQITAANEARLPRSRSDVVLRGKLRSPSLGTVLAFAQACGTSDNGLQKWRDAWIRAMNPEPRPPRNNQEQRPPLLGKRQMRDRLRPLIEGYNGQLSDLAREMNTSLDAIRDVLAARRRPSAQFARDLARVTGTPAEKLLTDLGWPTARQPAPNGRRQ